MDLAKFPDYKRPLHLEYQEMLDEYHTPTFFKVWVRWDEFLYTYNRNY